MSSEVVRYPADLVPPADGTTEETRTPADPSQWPSPSSGDGRHRKPGGRRSAWPTAASDAAPGWFRNPDSDCDTGSDPECRWDHGNCRHEPELGPGPGLGPLSSRQAVAAVPFIVLPASAGPSSSLPEAKVTTEGHPPLTTAHFRTMIACAL